MIISVDTEKASDRIQYQFVNKNSPQNGYRGNIPQYKKTIYDKPRTNILRSEKLKAFPLRSQTRQECPHTAFIQHSIGSLNHRNKTRTKNKRNLN